MEGFVEKKTAILLKDLGFPQNGLFYYKGDDLTEDVNTDLVAPLKAQAFYWLLKEYGLSILLIYNKELRGFSVIIKDGEEIIYEDSKLRIYKDAANLAFEAAYYYLKYLLNATK